MEIPLNAKVECVDGPSGESSAVIVNPVTQKMTHFVVHNEEMRPPRERLVPIEQVVETTHNLIRLGCTKEDVTHMAPFVTTRYIPKSQPDYSQYQGGAYYEPYASMVGVTYTKEQEEVVPEGERSFHRGARVEASDGHIGTVSELVVDEGGETISHFVLEEGHLWGKKEVALPLSTIVRVEGDTVYLKLDKKAIEQLPTIPLKRSYIAGEAKIELVAGVFDDPDQAVETLEFVEDLHRRHVIKILNAAVLIKDKEGNVSLKDTRDIDARKGRLLGAVTGGLIGLLAGPGGAVIGALAGAGTGAAAGKRIDMGFSDKFLRNLQQYLQPSSSALILLAEHEWAQKASEAIAGQEGVVFQQTITDTLVEDLLKAVPETGDKKEEK